VKTFDCKQGSTEWFRHRLGVVTASEADALISPLGKIRTGAGVDTYLYRKVAERVLGWSQDELTGFAPTQGQIIEKLALPWYAFTYECNVKQIGFCLSDDGRSGASPDALLDDGSGLEIKAPQGPNQIKYLLEGVVPEDYRIQIQWSIMVCDAPYWTFCSYSTVLPSLVVRVERDDFIQDKMREALALFNGRFDKALADIEHLSAVDRAVERAAAASTP
jgi:YqaJ-like viral recombinase domain